MCTYIYFLNIHVAIGLAIIQLLINTFNSYIAGDIGIEGELGLVMQLQPTPTDAHLCPNHFFQPSQLSSQGDMVACLAHYLMIKQEAQLMLTTGSTRLAVSRGQQTWYHSTCNI